MKLLEIAPNLLSLEFASGETEAVRSRLGRLGRVVVRREATFDLWQVAGEEFVQDNDWDQPCLIARTAAGSALLRFVAPENEPVRLAG